MPKVETRDVTRKAEEALERALLSKGVFSDAYTRGIIDTLGWYLREMGIEPQTWMEAEQKKRRRKGLYIVNAKT